MLKASRYLLLALLILAGCDRDSNEDNEGNDNSTTGQPTEQGDENTTPTPEPVEEFEGRRGEYFESTRFNVRFQLPANWELVSSSEDDSLQFDGPHDLQMVVANSESIQLVETNFAELNDRVSLESVNLLPDTMAQDFFNGMAGYRIEGDAVLRGEGLPLYFISQAVTPPGGSPIMATIFLPGDWFDVHSDEMRAVLDSIEAMNLRPE